MYIYHLTLLHSNSIVEKLLFPRSNSKNVETLLNRVANAFHEKRRLALSDGIQLRQYDDLVRGSLDAAHGVHQVLFDFEHIIAVKHGVMQMSQLSKSAYRIVQSLIGDEEVAVNGRNDQVEVTDKVVKEDS